MKVDIAVCGRFHYHKYVKYLAEKGVLNKIYFSYKRSFNFGLEKRYLQNYPLKEYLMFFNIRYLKQWRIEKNLLVLHKIWETQVARNKPKADILHIMIHGNSEKIIQKYKQSGKVVIGEAVNVYPTKQLKIINDEYSKLNQYNIVNFDKYTEEKMIREFQLCDYILVASQFVKNSFIEYGFKEENIRVIPYGSEANHSIFYKKTVPENNIKILCVGQITFRKGQLYLLEAAKVLREKGIDVQITLVGSKDNKYIQCIESKGLEKEYEYISHIPNENMRNFMSTFDLFVIPSLEDGFSVVVTEALSVGVPVITTFNNGASDIIIDGENGYKIPAADTNALSQSIMDARNHTFIIDGKDFYSWSDYTDMLYDFYQEVF